MHTAQHDNDDGDNDDSVILIKKPKRVPMVATIPECSGDDSSCGTEEEEGEDVTIEEEEEEDATVALPSGGESTSSASGAVSRLPRSLSPDRAVQSTPADLRRKYLGSIGDVDFSKGAMKKQKRSSPTKTKPAATKQMDAAKTTSLNHIVHANETSSNANTDNELSLCSKT